MSMQKLVQSVPRKTWLQIIIGFVVVAVGIIGLYMTVKSIKNRQIEKHAEVQRRDQLTAEVEQLMSQRKELAELEQRVDTTAKSVGRGEDASIVAGVPTGSRAAFADFSARDAFQPIKRVDEASYIPTGAVFQAKMITPIKTSIQESFVMAETTAEFRMDARRYILRGSRLIGRARLNPVLKGVVVEFYRLVNPAGLESSISGLALSENVFPELEGLFFSNDLERYSTALAFGFLSGFSDAAKDRDAFTFGYAPRHSWKNHMLSGLSTASFQIAEDLIRDIRERAVEYVVVPAGENIFVALTNRYVLNQGVR